MLQFLSTRPPTPPPPHRIVKSLTKFNAGEIVKYFTSADPKNAVATPDHRSKYYITRDQKSQEFFLLNFAQKIISQFVHFDYLTNRLPCGKMSVSLGKGLIVLRLKRLCNCFVTFCEGQPSLFGCHQFVTNCSRFVTNSMPKCHRRASSVA